MREVCGMGYRLVIECGTWKVANTAIKTLFRVVTSPESISNKPRRPRRSLAGIGINFRPIASYLLAIWYPPCLIHDFTGSAKITLEK